MTNPEQMTSDSGFAGGTSSAGDSNSANYVEISIPGESVQRWRVLFNWLIALPHWIVLFVLSAIGAVVWLLLALSVLFAGRIPQPFYRYLAGLARYTNRVWGFSIFYFTSYPSFKFMLDAPSDSSGYPIRTNFFANPGKVSRWRVLRPILAIPHYVLSYFLDIAGFGLGVAAALYALITGRYPDFLRAAHEHLATYSLRVDVYVAMVSDRYPRLG